MLENNYEENGFVILKNVIPLEMINDSLMEIEELINDQCKLYGIDIEINNFDKKIISLFNLNKIYRKHIFQALSTQMLSPFKIGFFLKNFVKAYGVLSPVHSGAAHVFHLPKEDHFLTEVHQDIGIMLSTRSLTCWYPLVPINEKNGRLKLYPGSHKLGMVIPYKNNYRGHSLIRPEIINQFDCVEIDMEPSDLLIFSTKLFHASSVNRSKNCRLASIIRFVDYQEKEFHHYPDSRFKEGYTMKKDSSSLSGFKENKEDLNKEKDKIIQKYKKLSRES